MMKITAACREAGYETDILLYLVEVENPDNYEEVQARVQEARNDDLEAEAGEMEVLFTFQGDIQTRSDFRQ